MEELTNLTESLSDGTTYNIPGLDEYNAVAGTPEERVQPRNLPFLSSHSCKFIPVVCMAAHRSEEYGNQKEAQRI